MLTNNKIPQSHQLEFLAKQALLAKSRVRLFCILILSLYFTITAGDFLLRPETYRAGEIWTGAILLLGGLSILYLNSKTRHLGKAKLNAFIFAALLHFMLFKLGLVYSEAAATMTTYYILTLFLVILFIPWNPLEASLIGLLNLMTFLLYGVTRFRIFGPSTLYLHLNGFIDGIILIAVSASLCVLIRKIEMGREIHNFTLLKEIESKNEQTRKELEFARRIHKTLIPDSISTEKADITVTYLPVDIIGGDYAKFHFYGKDRLIFIICDVTGHGVSAALLVNRVHAKYEELVKDGKEPGALLKELDAFVAKDFRDTHMYLTAFCGLLDFKKKNFFYSNYGHPPQYIYHATKNEVRCLNSQTTLLGLTYQEEKIYQSEMPFERGDKILLFTDGILETISRQPAVSVHGKIERFMQNNTHLTSYEFNQKLLEEMNAADRTFVKDDIFLLTIKIH